MSKTVAHSDLKTQIQEACALKIPIRRVNKLVLLVGKVKPAQRDVVIKAAMHETESMDQPDLCDVARDLIVDGLVDLKLFDEALEVAGRMEGDLGRALAYAHILSGARTGGNDGLQKRVGALFSMARSQLTQDERVQLADYMQPKEMKHARDD